MTSYPPAVNTRIGPGRLFRIEGKKAVVEFDFMYLVELPLSDVDIKGIDLTNVEVRGGSIDEERQLAGAANGREGCRSRV